MVKQIMNDLKEYGVEKERLALDTWDPGLVEGFTNAGLKLVPGLDIMLEARKLKNEDEVECLRTCSTIGDAMFSAMAANLRPGIKESELCGIMHEVAYRLGARIYSGVFVTSGPFAWPNPRDESDRIIRPGDIVYADVYNTAYNGYKICYYRTFSCGKASQKAKDDYKKSIDWLYDAIRIIKPGVTTKELAEKWPPGPEIWKDIHIVSEDQTAGSNWGHGIGLTLYEYPIIWREASLNDPIPLEKGMTFAIETQHGTPGSHGVRMEEMVHVTENGYEILSKWPIQEMIEVPLY
jgi:Xaa-Pro aminopeptidase